MFDIAKTRILQCGHNHAKDIIAQRLEKNKPMWNCWCVRAWEWGYFPLSISLTPCNVVTMCLTWRKNNFLKKKNQAIIKKSIFKYALCTLIQVWNRVLFAQQIFLESLLYARYCFRYLRRSCKKDPSPWRIYLLEVELYVLNVHSLVTGTSRSPVL